MDGWKRSMKFSDTGLIWVPTSPNVPYQETPSYLVSTGVLGELVVFGIGITYTLPFQTFAAEWIDADTLARKMNDLNLAGVLFRQRLDGGRSGAQDGAAVLARQGDAQGQVCRPARRLSR